MRTDKKLPQKTEKKAPARAHKRGVVGYSKKSALLEEAITHMNTGKYGRSSAALKELLTLDPHNTEARRLFATLHLRLGSLVTARQAFESLANEAIGRQDYWLAESLLREYLAAGPRCVPFLELLAHVYKEKGDDIAAVAELAKAINILVEDPDTDNPKKPAQLYAKIRDLAPASPAAFQLSSLFDIQTGEFLGPHSPVLPASVPLDESTSSSPGHALAPADNSETSEPMPWERVDPILPSDSAEPSPPMAQPLERADDSVAVAHPEPIPLEPLQVPVGSAPPDGQSNFLNLDGSTTLLNVSVTAIEAHLAAPSAESLPPTNKSRDWEDRLRQSAGETPSFSGQQTTGGEVMSVPSPGSTALSSPMPWEQIEHNTIRIQEVEPPPAAPQEPEPITFVAPTPILESSQTVQSETVNDSLSVSVSFPESSAPPVIEPEPLSAVVEPEQALPIQPDSPPPPVSATTSISWNAIFDGMWKFGSGTSAPSPPATLSTSEVTESDAETAEEKSTVFEPMQVEPASERAGSAPTLSASPKPSIATVETEALPIPPPASAAEWAISSSASELSNQEPGVTQPESSFLLQEPAQCETLPPGFQYAPSIDTTDLSIPAAAAPIEESYPGASTVEPLPALPMVDVPEPFVTAQSVSSTIPDAPLPTESMSVEEPAPSSHWDTGEVAVQTHRPSKKKRQWDKEKGDTVSETPTPGSAHEETSEEANASPLRGDAAPAETVIPVVETPVPQEDTRPEWARASDAITFVNIDRPAPPTLQGSTVDAPYTPPESLGSSTATSAVDVLFTSTTEKSHASTYERALSTKPRPRLSARVARLRQGFSMFIGSCFATTQAMGISFAVLVLASAGTLLAGIGAIGLAWIVMEEPPSSVYLNLTTNPTRIISDPNKNGYFLLLGFDAPPDRDPVQAGYERKVDERDRSAAAQCLEGDRGHGGASTTGASASVVRGWFASANPMEQFKGQGESIRMWAAERSTALSRYQQWLRMPFDDWGYGQILSPNCAQILHVHRLYLAEGFSQDFATGLERLEVDMGAWRATLGQSKTLMVKMLAATAIQDDVALVSAFLIRSDFDEATLGRLNKIVRPLDQLELSIRWPMQSHLVWASKNTATSLKHDKTEERPLHVSLVAAMSLPVQRRSNAYAEYYEAANKAVAEGRYTNLPKLSAFVRTPGTGLMDYLANPLEHIIGIEPMPSWDLYIGRMVETDARLRLASLQAWIRRGPQEGDLLARLAKAGQSHYDPFTGLPMLVNQQKGLIYSVGPDGKDQDADPVHDVVAKVPLSQSTKRSSTASIPK